MCYNIRIVDILYISSYFIAFIIGITVHECAHAWVGNKLGDPTAKDLGRISLNPISHIDLVGSILLPVLSLISSSGYFIGWAKPTPFNPSNLKDIKRDELLISLAGPFSNLLIACIVVGLFYGFFITVGFIFGLFTIPPYDNPVIFENIGKFLYYVIVENLFLAFFNLIPLPPLDGASILKIFMPKKFMHIFDFLGQYGFLILILASRTPLGNFVSNYLDFCVSAFLKLFRLM